MHSRPGLGTANNRRHFAIGSGSPATVHVFSCSVARGQS